MKQRDPLLWAALLAVLVVLASAEYDLARACGFGQYVAAGVPAALDIYAVRALRARRDVLVVVAALIAVNGASHLVASELLPVNVPLVVAVSAIAPLVLWRVHRLSEDPGPAAAEPVAAVAEQLPEPSSAPAEPAEPITVERAPEPVDMAPASPLLGPWTPVAELRGGTSGTGSGTAGDLLGDHFADVRNVIAEPVAEPAPEPSSAPVPVSGTGADDIETVDSSNTTFAARVATVRHWLEGEPELTGTEIGTRLGVSDGYGRRLLRTARDDS
ncbi:MULTISPECIES: hypothetical protein [unclassified Streptomyces]|uniref:hypothetical protein n=1 Tax=unclassified Streptomyces TaxID=2593676 RepID=UPI0034065064